MRNEKNYVIWFWAAINFYHSKSRIISDKTRIAAVSSLRHCAGKQLGKCQNIKHIWVIRSVMQPGILPLSAASHLHHLGRPFLNAHSRWAFFCFRILHLLSLMSQKEMDPLKVRYLSCEKVEILVQLGQNLYFSEWHEVG